MGNFAPRSLLLAALTAFLFNPNPKDLGVKGAQAETASAEATSDESDIREARGKISELQTQLNDLEGTSGADKGVIQRVRERLGKATAKLNAAEARLNAARAAVAPPPSPPPVSAPPPPAPQTESSDFPGHLTCVSDKECKGGVCLGGACYDGGYGKVGRPGWESVATVAKTINAVSVSSADGGTPLCTFKPGQPNCGSLTCAEDEVPGVRGTADYMPPEFQHLLDRGRAASAAFKEDGVPKDRRWVYLDQTTTLGAGQIRCLKKSALRDQNADEYQRVADTRPADGPPPRNPADFNVGGGDDDVGPSPVSFGLGLGVTALVLAAEYNSATAGLATDLSVVTKDGWVFEFSGLIGVGPSDSVGIYRRSLAASGTLGVLGHTLGTDRLRLVAGPSGYLLAPNATYISEWGVGGTLRLEVLPVDLLKVGLGLGLEKQFAHSEATHAEGWIVPIGLDATVQF